MSDHGKFVWYDGMTTELKAAETFYGSVFGWKMADAGMPDRSYTVLSVGTLGMGGLMPMPDGSSAPPVWFGYIAVDNVDEAAARIGASGGAVHRAPTDIPGIGRFAMVSDPDGAAFALFKSGDTREMPPVPALAIGHVGWRELHGGQPEAAFAFYAGMFGWTKTEALDMGAMGTYQMFATGDEAVGGMMKKMPEMPQAFWLYYFNVEAIDAAATRVTSGGGKIVMGPQEVPGGMWIVQCLDPQGAMFGMVAAGR